MNRALAVAGLLVSLAGLARCTGAHLDETADAVADDATDDATALFDTTATGDSDATADAEDDSAAPGDSDAVDATTDAQDVPDATDVAPVCGDCDDHLACTEDGCGADGLCHHRILDDFCAIDGKCVEAGAGSSCQVCVPAVDPTHYTGLTGGGCDDKDPCTTGEQCVGGICKDGVPVVCEAPDACHESLGCDPDDGGCGLEPLPDHTVCGPGKVCEAETCIDGDGLPTGTIAFFDATSCPVGWVLDERLVGRTAVGVGPERVLATAGEALASGEDRTHGHAYAGTATLGSTSYAGIAGGGNGGVAADGTVAVTGVAAPASAGIPYVQLLPCRKSSEAVYGRPADGVFGWFAAECPASWPASIATYDRLVVGTPEGGAANASFGAADSATGPDIPPHHHALTQTLPTPSHGIALVSGCCAGGFASSSGIPLALTSDDATVTFPWVGLQQCESPARVASDATPDTTPPGLVAWSRGASCPEGWSPLPSARGRVLVGAGLGGDVGLTVGAALADREDRTHVHTVHAQATLTQKNIAAADGGNNAGAANGKVEADLTSGPATSGLRFVQRLACRKD